MLCLPPFEASKGCASLSWWNLATVVPRCSWSRKDPPSNYLPKKWRDLGLMMFWILDRMFPGCWFFRFHVKFFGGKFVKVYQLGWMSVWLSNFALVFPYRPAGGRCSYWGGGIPYYSPWLMKRLGVWGTSPLYHGRERMTVCWEQLIQHLFQGPMFYFHLFVGKKMMISGCI